MTDFQFLSPLWLWLFLPLAASLVFSSKKPHQHSAWQHVIEPQLLKHLLVQTSPQKSSPLKWLLATVAAVGILALANPVWEKKPAPVFQTTQSTVLVLDLSASMNAADLAPSRMEITRLKIMDLLERSGEGQVGLVVFAGDAFTVSPLTRDNDTIRSQLRALTPELMPVQGSRLDLGLLQAGELLQQAAVNAGDIIALADGFELSPALKAVKDLTQQGHRVSLLGIGTLQGAPVSNGQGDVIRDASNRPVLAKLDEQRFRELAALSSGIYQRLKYDNSDIDALLSMPPFGDTESSEQQAQQQRWKENGPYLVLLLLPLVALLMRRGWLMTVVLVLLIPQPRQAVASGWDDIWTNLWYNKEQQASSSLSDESDEQLQRAIDLSQRPEVKGSAFYKQQNYAQAIEHFEQLDDADAHYNRGNSLARLGKYRQAIDAYEQALLQQPAMQDAIDNKKLLEELLMQQQDQQQGQSREQQQQDQQSKQQADQQADQQAEQQPQADQNQPNEDDNNPSQADHSAQSDQAGQPEHSEQPNQNPEAGNNDSQQNNPDQQKMDADARQAQNQNLNEKGAGQTQPDEYNSTDGQPMSPQASADPLTEEERQAAEQWLRRIPDDPGGLLKRKFLYQYQQRNRQIDNQQRW